jgi:hypothetical protein
MAHISTQLLNYGDISVDGIDLFEDAMGIYTEFTDVIELLDQLSAEPDDSLTKDLIMKVRELN